MSDKWTDELRSEVIAAYEEQDPTSENTLDIVKSLADQYDKTPNGIRAVLVKAGVYKTKTPAKAEAKETKDGVKRTSKASAIETLEAAIVAAGKEVDTEITSRLTGKAALYFAEILSNGTA